MRVLINWAHIEI